MDSVESGIVIQDAGWIGGQHPMVKPYSEDLRVRVVGRVEAGHPVRAVAETFGVSVSSVVKWSQRKRQTGSVVAKPMGSRQARSLLAQRDWMLARIAEKPDVTLRELVSELEARAVTTSYGSVWRLLSDEGISFKKKPARQRTRPA
jgi:transposase